jgi:hypothetical protein
MRIVPGQISGLFWTRAVLRAALSLAVCPGLLWSGVVACFAGLPALPEMQ